jgi:hypothetical protein
VEFTFTATIWLYAMEKGSGHFATPPQAIARQIRTLPVPVKPSVRSAEQVRAGESATITLIVEAETHLAN